MRKIKMDCRVCKIIIVILFSIGVTACGGGGGSSSGGGTDDSTVVQLSGNWVGSGASSIYPAQANVRVTINQSGTDINGTSSVSDLSTASGVYTCGGTADFSGSISGNNLTFEVATPVGKTEFSATATSNRISGTYRTISGPCSGDRGTFTLTRE